MVLINEIYLTPEESIKETLRKLAASRLTMKCLKNDEKERQDKTENTPSKYEDIYAAAIKEEQRKTKLDQTLALISLRPGNVKFSELKEHMHLIEIDGKENEFGVMGMLENVSEDDGSASQKEQDNADPGIGSGLKKDAADEVLERPLEGAYVWAHYSMYYEGEPHPFFSSKIANNGKPSILTPDVMDTVRVALRWTPVGRRALFLLPPHKTFGQLIKDNVQPRSEAVLLLLHSLQWLDAAAYDRYTDLDNESKKDFNIVRPYAEATKQLAKHYYEKKTHKNITQAFSHYKNIYDMLNMCETKPECAEELNALKVKVLVNLAFCHERSATFEQAMVCLEEASVLENYTHNCKALFLRGRLSRRMGEYAEASLHLRMALKLQPNNIEIGDELVNLEKRIQLLGRSSDLWSDKPAIETRKKDRDLIVEWVASVKATVGQRGRIYLASGHTENDLRSLETILTNEDLKMGVGKDLKYFITHANNKNLY